MCLPCSLEKPACLLTTEVQSDLKNIATTVCRLKAATLPRPPALDNSSCSSRNSSSSKRPRALSPQALGPAHVASPTSATVAATQHMKVTTNPSQTYGGFMHILHLVEKQHRSPESFARMACRTDVQILRHLVLQVFSRNSYNVRLSPVSPCSFSDAHTGLGCTMIWDFLARGPDITFRSYLEWHRSMHIVQTSSGCPTHFSPTNRDRRVLANGAQNVAVEASGCKKAKPSVQWV